MNMDTISLILWIAGSVGAVAMWLAKTWVDSIQRDIKALENDNKYIKDVYFKKEEFREFKQDLWLRLDRFENALESKIKILTKE